jgi:hypothetical protein
MKKLNLSHKIKMEIYNLYNSSRITNDQLGKKYNISGRSVYNIRKEMELVIEMKNTKNNFINSEVVVNKTIRKKPILDKKKQHNFNTHNNRVTDISTSTNISDTSSSTCSTDMITDTLKLSQKNPKTIQKNKIHNMKNELDFFDKINSNIS